MNFVRLASCLVICGLWCATAAHGADRPGSLFDDPLGLPSKTPPSDIHLNAMLTRSVDRPREASLRLVVRIPEGYHIYSQSERGEGTKPTRITVSKLGGLKPLDDEFQPDRPPQIVDEDGISLQEYAGEVTFVRRFEVPENVEDAEIEGKFDYALCNASTCLPTHPKKFTAQLMAAATAESSGSIEAVSDVKNSRSPESPGEQGALGARKPAVREASLSSSSPIPSTPVEQTDAATWYLVAEPPTVHPGDEVELRLTARLGPGWHVYATNTDEGFPTALDLTAEGLQPLDEAVISPTPIEKPGLEPGQVARYHEGIVTWSRRFQVPADAVAGPRKFHAVVKYVVCNKSTCRPARKFTATASLLIETASGNEIARGGHEPGGPGSERAPAVDEGPDGDLNRGATMERAPGLDKSGGLVLFLLAAALAGFTALLTPCVYPMVPITVSFFHHQAEHEHHRPLLMATAYCLAIIATFTGLGLLMSIFFGAASLNTLANNPWLNLFIAAVFITFALNLLGMFEIRIPSWLLTMTAGQESRGGYVGVLFMALTFTLTSFTCTFAFAGGLLAAAAGGDRLWPLLGLLSFSTAFALPFFFLALFPSILQKLPKSGGWMNVVKVLMGLIELGAAFKFLSVADQSLHPIAWFFDYELVMSAWLVLSIIAALYLLGIFRLSHDTPMPHVSELRLLGTMFFLGLASYLAVGLYGAREPTGKVWENIAAFAPPRFHGGAGEFGPYLEHAGVKYALDFDRALEYAVRKNRPLFLDFTGVNCINCRKMEKGPLSQTEIARRLDGMVCVQLYTDQVPVISDAAESRRIIHRNLELQSWFGDISLPSYAVVPPERDLLKQRHILAATIGYDPDAERFAAFLDKGLGRWRRFQEQHNGGTLVGRRH